MKLRTTATILPDLPRDTNAWYEARAQSIGASEVAMALGCSKYGGLSDLVMRKRDAIEGRFDDTDSEQLAEGREYEAAIVAVAGRRIKTRPEFADLRSLRTIAPSPSFASVSDPRLTATPDGLLVDDDSAIVAVIEAKRDRSGADWKEVAEYGWGTVPAGDLRLQYLIQIQTQMLVTGARFGILAVHTGFDTYLLRVHPDAEMQSAIAAAVPVVWRWILSPSGELPPLTACDSDDAANARLRGRKDQVEEPPEAIAAAMRTYAEASAAIKPLEAAKKAAGGVVRRFYTTTDAKRLQTVDGYKANLVIMGPQVKFDLKAALLDPAVAPLLKPYLDHQTPAAQVRITAPGQKEE